MIGIKTPSVCFAALLLFSTAFAHGQDNCDPRSGQCVAIGKINFSLALGIGERRNPLFERDDIPLYLVPQFSYYADRFFIENLDLGYTLFEGPAYSLSFISSPGYDRVFFYDGDPQNLFIDTAGGDAAPSGGGDAFVDPLNDPTTADQDAELKNIIDQRERDFTYLAGIEWGFDYGNAQIQLDLLHEITGEHKGNEIRSAVAFPLVDNAWQLTLSFGATWKSKEIITYYYGAPEIFEMDASVIPFAKIGFRKKLSSRWSILGLVHYERLGSKITISPIVEDNDITTAFLGGVYSF